MQAADRQRGLLSHDVVVPVLPFDHHARIYQRIEHFGHDHLIAQLHLGYTRAEPSGHSVVRLGTLRLSERKGQPSLETVVRIAFALRTEAEFTALFPRRGPMTIKDVIEKPLWRRGWRLAARAGAAS